MIPDERNIRGNWSKQKNSKQTEEIERKSSRISLQEDNICKEKDKKSNNLMKERAKEKEINVVIV